MPKENDIDKAIKGLEDLRELISDGRINVAIAMLRSSKSTIVYLKGRVRNLQEGKKTKQLTPAPPHS